jgi:Xaa-Pro aminopeptidase
VATEVRPEPAAGSVPGEIDLGDGLDRVLRTADDRPNTDTLPALVDPAADHADGPLAARRADVEEKHRRVAAFLERAGYDAVVLGRADAIAWFTAGGDLGQGLGADAGAVLLFITPQSRAVVADNVQSARVFEEEVAGLGFQLKERPWHEDPGPTLEALGRGKAVAADVPLDPWPSERERLRALRLTLTLLERQRLRVLGRTLAVALEATCRNFDPGETEAHIAGHLAHRLLREGVVPVDLRVASDDRLARYRQPRFKAAAVHRRATIAATGRRHGLCASATRTVSFGPVDPQFRRDHGLATMVDATCIYFSRPGEAVGAVVRRARRIYEKYGRPHEWTLDYQGAVTGYAPQELPLRPDGPLVLEAGMALRWSPSVGSARSEDTMVVDARGFEVVTEAQRWPQVEVAVKGFTLPRPGILER